MKETQFVCKRRGCILALMLLLPLLLSAQKTTAPQGEVTFIYTQEKAVLEESEQDKRRIEGTVADENGDCYRSLGNGKRES